MLPILLGAPRIKIDANTNIIIDGNSLYALAAGQGLQQRLAAAQPFAGTGCSFATVAIGGQRWQDMVWGSSDADAAYVPGKQNILVAGECTNSAYFYTTTGAEMWALAVEYMQARKDAHPDLKIVICGSVPYFSGIFPGEVAGGNDRMLDYDAIMKAQWKQYADAMVDYRTSLTPAFNHDGSQVIYFQDYADHWSDQYMHPSLITGNDALASAIGSVVRRMPRN